MQLSLRNIKCTYFHERDNKLKARTRKLKEHKPNINFEKTMNAINFAKHLINFMRGATSN